jgi:hypothetical protein
MRQSREFIRIINKNEVSPPTLELRFCQYFLQIVKAGCRISDAGSGVQEKIKLYQGAAFWYSF